jgi:hypothetical protein
MTSSSSSFFQRLESDPSLAVKELKEDKPLKHSINPLLPQAPFMMGVIAPRKSGKTYMIVDLLRDKDKYKGYFDLIFVFSKSMQADSKWRRNLALPKTCVFNEWKPDVAERIFNEAVAVARENSLKNTPKVLLLFDDLASEGTMTPFKQGVLEKIATTGRHFQVSCIFISQNIMRLSHTVRNNLTNLAVFRIRNAQEYEKIMTENREGLNKDEFFQIYNSITSQPYHFLHINNQQDNPAHRFSDCWDCLLELKKTEQHHQHEE